MWQAWHFSLSGGVCGKGPEVVSISALGEMMGMHANDMQIGNNTGDEEGMPLLQPQSVLSARDDEQKAQ